MFRRSHSPKLSLTDLAEAIETLGLPKEIVAQTVLVGYLRVFGWESEAVWPFFSERLEVLQQAFEPLAGDWQAKYQRVRERDNALGVLAKFPQVPPALIGKLWELATGGSKADRERAQLVAVNLPDLQERLAQSLGSGYFQTRMVAAEWLGRLGDRRAVTPLHAFLAKKEKQDAALDEMLTALEKLGESIDPYLDRDKLPADAEKGLKKGLPEALAWFPWAGLPRVRWADSGEQIPAAVITWLLVQNFKLKSAEPGPLLKRYCALMNLADREELGRHVLIAWIDQDTKRKFTDAEARAAAQQRTAQMWPQVQKYYQGKKTQQQLEDELFQNLQRECGSASAEKGLLAVAGACCGQAAVAPVQKYLKEWYGYRAAQCKALIAMLSGVDHPAAIQYLLSISNRFRTKGIREEAERYVSILAERKGWTLDELADRTMPTAGLDDDGKLELSFGPRRFVLRANNNLEAVLQDAEGKILKSLPAPRKEDDEEQAKAAKKSFSAAKTDLKKFVGQQATRLYEAMCTERTWPVADWRMYLMGHPLLKFLCQRLVWAVCDDDRVTRTFRPLDDGTLTDCDDGEVTLADSDKIRLAHGCQIPAAAAGWTKHLADYDVAPLFTQFGREAYSPPENKRAETAIRDFTGHVVEAFKLRGLATKFCYGRGPAQDGGWFFDYVKVFPGLKLQVHLNFSGNGLPEENRPVALTEMVFQRSGPERATFFQPAANLALAEVPAVLLTECYNDLRTIAAAGTGFDPEWEKKMY